MDKRIYLAIAGVAVVAGAIWLSTRSSDAEAETLPQPIASNSGSAVASGSAAVDPPSESAHSTVPAHATSDSAVEAAPPPGSPPQASGQSLPIDTAPGFEYLNTPAAEMKDTDHRWPSWRRHQQLQSEPRDDEWAPRMEAALRKGIQDSLIAKGLDPSRIELAVLECRTNGCEIQAYGYTADNGKDGVDLQFILGKLLMGPLGAEFDMEQFSGSMSGSPDQRIAFLFQLPRKTR